MNSIPRFEHRTVAWKCTVDADKLKLGAQIARSVRIEERHFAGILFALDKVDGVVPSGNKGIDIFERAADLVAIDGQRTVSVLTFGE